jgi:hypothetical protein
MLGNDRQQIIHKFSFIESLDFSQQKNRNASLDVEEDLGDRASSSPQQQDGDRASAIVAAEDKTSAINANWHQSNSNAYRSNVAYPNSTSGSSTETKPEAGYLGKVLFAFACSYCLFVLWWLFGHQGTRVLTMLTGGKQVVLSESEVQFIDYMERSLNKIEDRIAAKATESDDVVYVPVYTPTATPQIPPALPNDIPVVQQPIPPSLKIPAPPPLPTPTPLADNPGNENEIVTAIEPAISRSLIGVLELGGDKSAALVKVKGKTRRVWLGEEISDGWILESIGNQKANISYQGQVRSVSVGETF